MKQTYVLAGIWLATLVVTAVLTWKVSTRTESEAEDVGDAVAMADTVPVSPPSEDDGPSDELAALREALERLQAENEALREDYEALSLAKSTPENQAIDTAPNAIGNMWERQLDAIRKGNDSFTIESRFGLMFAFTTYGDAGVEYLDRVIKDRRRSLAERETALLVLQYTATPRALETLLAFRDPGLTQLDYPYDLIGFQLKTMRTGAIQQHFSGIISQINKDLGADDYSPERVEVLLTLASTHNDARARELLRDPRIYQENLRGAIQLAETLDTAVADEFLLDLSQNHGAPHVQWRAGEAYAPQEPAE